MKKKRIVTKMMMILLMSLMMTFNSVQTFAIANEQYIGEVHLMAFNFPPRGWQLCRGQILNISQNAALFSLLGTQFGGNGQQTFALPDLQAAEPQIGEPGYGMHYCIALQGVFPSRD